MGSSVYIWPPSWTDKTYQNVFHFWTILSNINTWNHCIISQQYSATKVYYFTSTGWTSTELLELHLAQPAAGEGITGARRGRRRQGWAASDKACCKHGEYSRVELPRTKHASCMAITGMRRARRMKELNSPCSTFCNGGSKRDKSKMHLVPTAAGVGIMGTRRGKK